MSRENVELVRQGYELWNSDEVDQWLALFHPSVEFMTSGVFPGFDPVYRGRDGLTRFRGEMLEAWEYFHIEPTAIMDRGGST